MFLPQLYFLKLDFHSLDNLTVVLNDASVENNYSGIR